MYGDRIRLFCFVDLTRKRTPVFQLAKYTTETLLRQQTKISFPLSLHFLFLFFSFFSCLTHFCLSAGLAFYLNSSTVFSPTLPVHGSIPKYIKVVCLYHNGRELNSYSRVCIFYIHAGRYFFILNIPNCAKKQRQRQPVILLI